MSPLWQNWAGQQRCAPTAIERPRSEEELAELVARSRGPLKVVGSGHSFTDIACTDGLMLDLSRLDQVRSVDGELVTVEAGITLAALGVELAERGLALENQGDIDRQSLAGALATGTHGTGARFRNLSAKVAALRLVDGSGEVVDLSGKSDPDAWRAARVGLGALGVVSALTLRCVPLFTVRRVDEPRPLADTLDRLDEHADRHHHFELYAFPHADKALCRFSERIDGAPEPESEWRLWVQERVLENAVMGAAARAGRLAPALIPPLNRGITGLVSRSVKVDRSHRVYASRRAVRFTEMEYAIPRAHAREAVERVLELVPRRSLPVGFPIEVRFVAGDDALLSPSHGRDTCYVAVHQYLGMEYETYFRAVESIMDDYGGRPHWGKRHYQSAATLAPRYPEWERFASVRARLDPHGRFENDYTRRVLGELRGSGGSGGPR
jgi:L-gulono-1,4-lactone dehydrogenase